MNRIRGLREAALLLSPNSVVHWQRRQHPQDIVVDGVTLSIPIYIDHVGLPLALYPTSRHSTSFTSVSKEFVTMFNLGGFERQPTDDSHPVAKRSRRTAVLAACLAALVVGALQTPLTGPFLYNDAVQKYPDYYNSHQVSPHAAFQVVLIECAIYALLVILFVGIALRWANASNHFCCCYCNCNHISINYERHENSNDFNLTYISI